MKFLKYLLNMFLWVVMCIPVITISASTTAMNFVNLKLAEGEDVNVVKKFFESFRLNFLESLPLLAVYGLFGFFVGYTWKNLLTVEDPNPTLILVMVVPTFLYLILVTLSHFLLAKFDNKFFRLLGLTLYMGVGHIDQTIKVGLLFAVCLLVPAIIVFVNVSWVTIIIGAITLVVLFMIAQYLSAKIMNRIFAAYIKLMEEQKKASGENINEW